MFYLSENYMTRLLSKLVSQGDLVKKQCGNRATPPSYFLYDDDILVGLQNSILMLFESMTLFRVNMSVGKSPILFQPSYPCREHLIWLPFGAFGWAIFPSCTSSCLFLKVTLVENIFMVLQMKFLQSLTDGVV